MFRKLLVATALMSSPAVASAVECSVEDATYQVEIGTIERAADISKKSLPVLDQISAINAKAKDPQKSVGSQLAPADIEKFGRLQQRFMTLQMSSLMESNLARDMKVIRLMYEFASNEYSGTAKLPTQGTPEFNAALMLYAVREFAQKENWPLTEVSQESVCTVEVALQQVEYIRIKKLDQLDLGHASKQMEEIAQRTPSKDKITSKDRATVERINRDSLLPGIREQQFLYDLENLKGLWAASLLRYETTKKDIADTAGDPDAIGETLDTKSLSPRERVYVNTILKISELIPSDQVKNMKLMSDIKNKLPPPTDIRPVLAR